MCQFKPSLKEFFFFSSLFKSVHCWCFLQRCYMYVWPMFGLMLSVFVCILEGLFIGEVTTSWSSLNMDLKFFSTWDHSLDYFWLFLVRKSLVFESCGMFSLQEVGLFNKSIDLKSLWLLYIFDNIDISCGDCIHFRCIITVFPKDLSYSSWKVFKVKQMYCCRLIVRALCGPSEGFLGAKWALPMQGQC